MGTSPERRFLFRASPQRVSYHCHPNLSQLFFLRHLPRKVESQTQPTPQAKEDTPPSTQETASHTFSGRFCSDVVRGDKRERFGKGAGMGCGKWKNWVMLQLRTEFTLDLGGQSPKTWAQRAFQGEQQCHFSGNWKAEIPLAPWTTNTDRVVPPSQLNSKFLIAVAKDTTDMGQDRPLCYWVAGGASDRKPRKPPKAERPPPTPRPPRFAAEASRRGCKCNSQGLE